ncbi:hypothetical protein L917_15842, partial [Phytophthora nicotianae]
MASPALSEPYTSDDELLASFLDWGPDSDFGSRAHDRSRALSSTPPAPTEVPAVPAAMVDAPAVAVTLPSPLRAPVATSPSDAATEAPVSSLVPSRSVTPPVGSSEIAIAFGVSREDVTEFWKTLQRQSVLLNYGTMLPNILHEFIGSVATLERFFEAL